MINKIAEETQKLWTTGRKVKKSSSDWHSGNAPCCIHNGETADKKGRGGMIFNSNGSISFHCFNCQYTANYTPGRHLSYKFRKLLSWLGADEGLIRKLVIDAIRIKELMPPDSESQLPEQEVKFTDRSLPDEAKELNEIATFYEIGDYQNIPEEFTETVLYVAKKRNIDTDRYNFYWTPETQNNLDKRVIVPFFWKNRIIGYTARTWKDNIEPKYFSSYDPNYVFNIDKQMSDSKFVIVVEGPFDAMAIDGVAVLGGHCNETQADIIESLGKEVILVPDADQSGANLVNQAIEYGWSVSFPLWQQWHKDASEAVRHYGKLFVLKSILAGKQSSKLKIELYKRRLYR